jgi:hypothetical protein
MAMVGTGGSGWELPISAVAAAVTTQNEPAGCNAGFVRDDAILVVTIISDDYPMPGIDDDLTSVGSPQEWYDAVVGAKHGDADDVVVLGIVDVATSTCMTSDAGVVPPAERFVQFVERFGDRGLTGDVCSADYSTFFDQAVALIDGACDEFTPEG